MKGLEEENDNRPVVPRKQGLSTPKTLSKTTHHEGAAAKVATSEVATKPLAAKACGLEASGAEVANNYSIIHYK